MDKVISQEIFYSVLFSFQELLTIANSCSQTVTTHLSFDLGFSEFSPPVWLVSGAGKLLAMLLKVFFSEVLVFELWMPKGAKPKMMLTNLNLSFQGSFCYVFLCIMFLLTFISCKVNSVLCFRKALYWVQGSHSCTLSCWRSLTLTDSSRVICFWGKDVLGFFSFFFFSFNPIWNLNAHLVRLVT